MPFIRPNLPYDNQSLPNDSRFRILTRALDAPPTDIMLDSEFNALTDGLNVLETTIAGIVLGDIPGADDPNNANFVLSTTGAAIQWIQVSDINIAPQSISGNKLIPASVTNIQLGIRTILDENISANTITNGSIALNTIRGNNIANNTITGSNIATNTIDASLKIIDGSISSNQLGISSVTTIKIAPLAVTAAKIALNAITTSTILDANVTTSKLANNAVTAPKIADQTITFTQIANNTITFNQINNNFTATKVQQQAASSSSVYVSPAQQQNHPSANQASVLFNGINGNIIVQYGISNVTKIGTGVFRITFTNPFSTGSYVSQITGESNPTSPRIGNIDISFSSTTTQIQINMFDKNGNLSDSDFINCTFSGTLA